MGRPNPEKILDTIGSALEQFGQLGDVFEFVVVLLMKLGLTDLFMLPAQGVGEEKG